MKTSSTTDLPIKVFHGTGANDVWLEAITHFNESHNSICQSSRLGETLETLHANFHIYDPRQRWVASRQPAISPAFAIAEVVWILTGSNDSKFLNFWNPILPKFMGLGETYHGAYGFRIKNQFNFDQLEQAYTALKTNPSTRQVVIQIWNSSNDFPDKDGSPVSPDIPCNICSMPKIRDGKLEWLQIMRSNDLYRGTPYNIVQFTTLQEILAGWLGIEVGSYHQLSDSLHIYCSDLDELDHLPHTIPSNGDSLSLPKTKFDSTLEILNSQLRELASESLNCDLFKSICKQLNLPHAYKNLFYICAADAARRHKWPDEMEWAASMCDNDLLSLCWNNWKERWSK